MDKNKAQNINIEYGDEEVVDLGELLEFSENVVSDWHESDNGGDPFDYLD